MRRRKEERRDKNTRKKSKIEFASTFYRDLNWYGWLSTSSHK